MRLCSHGFVVIMSNDVTNVLNEWFNTHKLKLGRVMVLIVPKNIGLQFMLCFEGFILGKVKSFHQ